jgi:hypothetical protein
MRILPRAGVCRWTLTHSHKSYRTLAILTYAYDDTLTLVTLHLLHHYHSHHDKAASRDET